MSATFENANSLEDAWIDFVDNYVVLFGVSPDTKMRDAFYSGANAYAWLLASGNARRAQAATNDLREFHKAFLERFL